MRSRLTLLILLGLGLACTGTTTPDDSGDSLPGDSTGDSQGDSAINAPTSQHCGELRGDEVWTAEASPHLVTCDFEVVEGSLTIEAGAELVFSAGAGILVAEGDYAATLTVAGTAEQPVTMISESEVVDEATWEGIALGELAEDCSLSHLTMEGAGDLAKGAITVDDAPLHVDNLTLNGSAKSGIYLKGTGHFTEGSQGLVISGAVEPVSIDISQGHTVPGTDCDYTGNTQDTISLRGSELEVSATWSDLGVPFLVEEVAEVSGTAESPAILTIEPNVSVLFAKSAGLAMSKDGGASGLVAEGSTEQPITFGPLGANEAGYWRGVELYNGVEQASLSHVDIAWAGAGTSRGALTVHSCTATLQQLTLRDSADAGLAIRGTGRLAEESSGLLIYNNEVAVKTWAGGVGDLPSQDSSYVGNTSDVISIEESGEIPHSATWPDLGLPYAIDEDLLVEGSSTDPAVLTLEPGLELQFGNNTGLFMSKVGGAAGLIAEGTEEAPIELVPRDSNAAGAWAGVGFYAAAEAASCRMTHVHISGGGGKTLKGNIHLKEVDATLSNVVVDNSLEWGVYVEADTQPDIVDLSGSDNVEGLIHYVE